MQLLKSATDTCRLSIHVLSGGEKNLKIRFGHKTLVLYFILFLKTQKPPF